MSDDKCKWKSEYLPDYECHEPPFEGDEKGWCILHSEKKDKEIQKFTDKVNERITKGRLTPSGWETDKIDLRGCYFPEKFLADDSIERVFNKPIDFSEATFSQGANFIGATFWEEANFTEATFSQTADFVGAVFSKANFVGVTFSKAADFTGATFSQAANFSGARFSKGADFRVATFSQVADFSEATFSQEANFTGATFSKEAVFNSTIFTEESVFRYARFEGETIRFQDVDLSRCSFLHSNIDKVDFRDCKFGEDREYLLGFFPINRQNVIYDERNATTKDGFDMAGRLYRNLVKNFDEKGDRHMATEFFYGEIECKRKQLGFWGRSFSLYAFSRQITGYGVRLERSSFFICFLLVVSCFFYQYHEGLCFSEAVTNSLFGINVLTANIYNYVDRLSDLGQWFFWFEAVAGTFLTAVLVLTFQRVFTPFR